ncbi:MAG: hypothetical protein V1744_02445 [Candidatus Altiarchaeota archaeon]
MVEGKKGGPPRDPRLAGIDQVKFSKNASDVLDMFSDKSMASHSLLSKSGQLASGHGLAGPTGVKSDRFDPLKAEAEKVKEGGFKGGAGQREEKSYKKHVDKLSDVYDQYLNVDLGSGVKKKKPI